MSDVDLALRRCGVLITQQRWLDVVSQLQPLTRSDPENARVWSRLALAQVHVAELTEAAVHSIARALRLDPQDPEVLRVHAVVGLRMASDLEALQIMAPIVGKMPEDAVIQSMYSVALLRNERNAAAVVAARRAVTLQPSEPGHRITLAETLLMGFPDDTEAIIEARQQLALAAQHIPEADTALSAEARRRLAVANLRASPVLFVAERQLIWWRGFAARCLVGVQLLVAFCCLLADQEPHVTVAVLAVVGAIAFGSALLLGWNRSGLRLALLFRCDPAFVVWSLITVVAAWVTPILGFLLLVGIQGWFS